MNGSPTMADPAAPRHRAVVVGGGAIGLASACALQDDGWHVTVADQGDLGRGCSYSNAGLICPSHSDPIPGAGVILQALKWMFRRDSPFHVRLRPDFDFLQWSLLFRRYCNSGARARGFQALLGLSRMSLDLFEQLHAQNPDFFYERKGLLGVFLSREGLSHAERDHRQLQENGFESKLLTREETIAFEPALGGSIIGALFVEGEAHGSCFGYMQSLAGMLAARKARLLTGRRVSSLVLRQNRVAAVVLDSPREEIPADIVVLAAGSWTPDLTRSLRVTIPLQPAKGYSCTIDNYEGGPRLPVLIHERRVILTPLGERLRFAGTLELAGFDPTLDRVRYAALIRAARLVLQSPPPLRNEEAWCGLRPVTPDGLPIIDRVPGMEGMIVATGHAMLGFTQSQATGKLVAELAAGRTPSLPLHPFRLDRFRV